MLMLNVCNNLPDFHIPKCTFSFMTDREGCRHVEGPELPVFHQIVANSHPLETPAAPVVSYAHHMNSVLLSLLLNSGADISQNLNTSGAIQGL